MTMDFKKLSKNFWVLFGLMSFAHLVTLIIMRAPEVQVVRFVEKPAPIKVTFLPEHFDVSKKEKVINPKEKKQIVQSEESADSSVVDTKFLSDKNRKFDRQRLARNVDTFKSGGKGAPAVAEGQAAKPSAAKKTGIKSVNLSDLGQLAMGEGNPLAQGAKIGQKAAPVRPSQASASNDYIQDVALGDFTQVNTTEFKYFGYYHRIRQKLEQFWGRSIQEKAVALHRSGRRLPASVDLVTSLKITLNEKGEIVRVKVLGTSGVKELDDAAIESFNEAGPFPNPPKDLLVGGEATIEWGFVVKS